VAFRLWRLRWQLIRILFRKAEGQVESLGVYFQLGRLVGLIRRRERYDAGLRLLASLANERRQPTAINLSEDARCSGESNENSSL
jgi:hypothetical protein